jgi:hypothetical protein
MNDGKLSLCFPQAAVGIWNLAGERMGNAITVQTVLISPDLRVHTGAVGGGFSQLLAKQIRPVLTGERLAVRRQ